jgi:hypothetical protein
MPYGPAHPGSDVESLSFGAEHLSDRDRQELLMWAILIPPGTFDGLPTFILPLGGKKSLSNHSFPFDSIMDSPSFDFKVRVGGIL